MTPVTLNLFACVVNLLMYIFWKHHVNIGCAVISGSFALAFYFFPAGMV